MKLSQKIVGIGLAAVTMSAVAGVAATSSNFFSLARADNTYTMKCYARVDIGDDTHYLTYTSQKLEITTDETQAIFTLSFSDNSTVSIKRGSTNIGWSSSTNFNTSAYNWKLVNGQIYNADESRIIMFQDNDTLQTPVHQAKVYAISNIGAEHYYPVYFYTQDEYDAREGFCGWTEFQQSCLNNLIYENANNIPPAILDDEGDTPIPPIPTGETIEITPSDLTACENVKWEKTVQSVTLSCSTGTITADQIRVFKNQTLTISYTSNIKSIQFTCTASGNAKYGPGCFTTSSGYTYSDNIGTWTGNANSVTFTASTNQVRITKIIITY